MKVRQGFVSNSSSSSFVVLKSDVPEELQELFELLISAHNYRSSDGRIIVGERAYFGRIDHHECDDIEEFLSRNNIPSEGE